MVELLDCTIRDGGYYCNWDYSDDLVARYVDAVANAGLQYVEIGFRTKPAAGFTGKYSFCKDHYLQTLFHNRSVHVTVMIDGKSFISRDHIDETSLRMLFRPRTESPVEFVRITTTVDTIAQVTQIVSIIKSLGYMTALNLMQVSTLSERELITAAHIAESSVVDVFYLADSFGGLSPFDTRQRLLAVKAHFSRRTGFHGHDNLGLGLANTLSAIDAGVDMVDGSLRGMGRGAGNVRTEQLLLYLHAKAGYEHIDPSATFEVVSSDFEMLQQKYHWGTNLPYTLAGIYNVHPMYAQHLLTGGRYSAIEVVRVLEGLHAGGVATRFDVGTLTGALRERHTHRRNRTSVSELVGYVPTRPSIHADRPILIIGSGPSIRERQQDINAFIRAHQPTVMECNLQSVITAAPEHYSLFTNYRRLEAHAPSLAQHRRRVILGMNVVSKRVASQLADLAVWQLPYHVAAGELMVGPTESVIPHDVVAMYAVAIALHIPQVPIFLCGFDGYFDLMNAQPCGPVEEQRILEREMENFFRLLKESPEIAQRRIVSLTPTMYDVVQESLYAYV